MALKFAVETMLSNMSKLCVITISTLTTWEAKSIKIAIYCQKKSGNGT